MSYPGTLLTSLKNDTANRLFNVALTRTKGKFILVANIDYLTRKKISKKLIFTQAIYKMKKSSEITESINLLDELMPYEKEKPIVYFEDREESWTTFISDIATATRMIQIEMPDVISDDAEKIDELIKILELKSNDGVNISIRVPDDIDIPVGLQKHERKYNYVTTPVTIIDGKTLWFGQPLYSADFISEGEILDTEHFLCARFCGTYTARLLQAFLEI
jgi:hypothetical protein